MKKFLNSLFIVLLVFGILGGVFSFKGAMVAFSGETINLNEATKPDFSGPAKIEGEIYYVYDCVAVEEVTHTSYGIETSKDETNFYLIETYSKEQYEDGFSGGTGTENSLTVLFSTSNKDTIATLDKMVEDWYDYEDDMYEIIQSAETEADLEAIYDLPRPETTLTISGMIDEYSDMAKLNGYRDEYIENMGYEGDELTQYIDDYCVDMIITNTDVDRAKTIFIGAVILAVVGLVGLIISIVSSKRKKASEELY